MRVLIIIFIKQTKFSEHFTFLAKCKHDFFFFKIDISINFFKVIEINEIIDYFFIFHFINSINKNSVKESCC